MVWAASTAWCRACEAAPANRRGTDHVTVRGCSRWSASRSWIWRMMSARLSTPTSPWGSETQIRARSPRYDRLMWSLLYLVVRALVRLLVRGGRPDRDDGSKDLEILVLRPQLRVLQRTAGRPQL